MLDEDSSSAIEVLQKTYVRRKVNRVEDDPA
jgi:hypothetical protein